MGQLLLGFRFKVNGHWKKGSMVIGKKVLGKKDWWGHFGLQRVHMKKKYLSLHYLWYGIYNTQLVSTNNLLRDNFPYKFRFGLVAI